MNENIKVEYKGNYVHAQKSGPDNYNVSMDLWKRIVAICEKQQCFNIFGETFTTEPLTTLDAYYHIKIFKTAGITYKHRIAWVHHVKETLEPIKFVETVLRNRNLANGYLFPTDEKAMDWLLGNSVNEEQHAGNT